jgi:deoxyribose-phosphate aldolase
MESSKSNMHVAIGSDHGGFEYKEELKKYLETQGYIVDNVGTFGKESVDYPVFAYKVAQKVASGECQKGIMIDAAGIGSCMAANKVQGILAANCYDKTTARNSREHNNANVLTLGARLISIDQAKEILDEWLNTECTEERHQRRAAQIHQIPKGLITFTSMQTNPGKKNAPTVNNQNNSGVIVPDLSPDDLERIVQEITSILKSQGISQQSGETQCSCCGSDCGGLCAEKSSEAVRGFINIGAKRISYTEGGTGVPQDIAKYIDHTLLRPDANNQDIKKLCEEARTFGFASVCINPIYVKFAANILKHTSVKVCTVIGFPFGTHLPEIKAMETRRAIRDGAREIDMVINIAALKNRDLDLLFQDIRGVVEACDDGGAICKVIFETALLTDEEKVIASQIAKKARADFVKTSTGYASGGATAHDVALMAEVVRGTGIGVKASGGIRSYEDAMQMIKAGATRIGASASVKIVKGIAEVTESQY